ncbi:MAG TPA: RHS repeat-associated core domain-containing protein [Terracidiphilus sp.]|nr:RHS repeat-associated core domain-containing protein [Terracidiphilus sp.]
MTEFALCASDVFSSPSRSTGKERDPESGNDYFGARYYASSMGRWLSPDWASFPMAVPFADFTNPQSLNLYSYVLNRPLARKDIDGHYHCNPDRSSTSMDANGVLHLTVTQGECYLDPGDFPNVTVAKAQNWFNRHLNPVTIIAQHFFTASEDEQRAKADYQLYQMSMTTLANLTLSPNGLDSQQTDQTVANATNAYIDYVKTVGRNLPVDLSTLISDVGAVDGGEAASAVERAVTAGTEISADSLRQYIETGEAIDALPTQQAEQQQSQPVPQQ